LERILNSLPNPPDAPQGSPGHPERPIESKTDDALGRDGFVRRLVSAVINERTKRSTGVVIGITGPWGSGKSSILNLVQERIRAEHENAVVVRFDPWLMSGRNDLISAFLAELRSAIKTTPQAAALLKTATATISKYGQHLAPAVNMFLPGYAAVALGGMAALRARFFSEEGIAALRGKLLKELSDISIPIVVLIDEIDRVEDQEIRDIAQLVRAVADFPSVSYILAYDPDRVAQALGSDAPEGQQQERGRVYLEKIVQLQLPLPVLLDDELSRLLTSEFHALVPELNLPENFAFIEDYQELLRLLCGSSITTLRDVGRLVGTYHALRGMLSQEVDWIDLLAYCALLVKAPGTIAALRQNPGLFLGHIVSYRDIKAETATRQLSPRDKLGAVLPKAEDTPSIRAIVEFIFPHFGEFASHRRVSGDALRHQRPLLTALRLGVLPNAASRQDIEAFATSTGDSIAQRLHDAYKDNTIDGLIERLNELYPDLDGIDHVTLWKGIAAFLHKGDCEWMSSYTPMHEIARNFATVLEDAVERKPTQFLPIAQKVFGNLLNADEDVLIALWIRTHIFAHALYGRREQTGRKGSFLSKDDTEAVAAEFSLRSRSAHLSNRLIPCRWDLQPVYTMIDTGIWDDVCRLRMDESLQDPRAVDGFTIMLYGGTYATERVTVGKMCSLDIYLNAVKERLASSGPERPHETALVALRKASDSAW
jgi:hypothetical protein